MAGQQLPGARSAAAVTLRHSRGCKNVGRTSLGEKIDCSFMDNNFC